MSKKCKYYYSKNWTVLKTIDLYMESCYDERNMSAIKGEVNGTTVYIIRRSVYNPWSFYKFIKNPFKSQKSNENVLGTHYRFDVGAYDGDWEDGTPELDTLWQELQDIHVDNMVKERKAVFDTVC